MRRVANLLHRFRRDERGVFGVLFGLLAVVLIAVAGSVVDFASLEQARTRAQTALDSAALALQPRITTDTNATLKTKAQALLTERIADGTITATVNTVTTNTTEGSILINASLSKPTAFVRLVGITTMTSALVSQATRKRLNLEVAMVLDNSGSMTSSSRMTNLKSAANNAVSIMFGGQATQNNVFIGVVPFTEFVNVGTANATASWMDITGNSQIARENFDTDDYDGNTFAGPVNRFSLYSSMATTPWQGCVEARLPPYDTNDTPPTASTPDTLFVPEFAPDEPDTSSQSCGSSTYCNSYLSDVGGSCTRTPPLYVWTEVKNKCSSKGTNSSGFSSSCTGTTTDTYQQVSELGVTTTVTSTRPTSIFNNPDPGATAYVDGYTSSGSTTNNYINTRVRTWTYDFSDREYQERMCKYSGVKASTSLQGPNTDCPAAALLPMTNVAATVTSKINSMVAEGGTNIHQGAIWGFHMLSPTEPLTEGRAYDTATYKVMILMTDGENTAYDSTGVSGTNINGLWLYSAYGFPSNSVSPFTQRISGTTSAQLQTSMDTKLKTTCTNAKAAGITVYTIGLATDQTTNPTTTKGVLTACATDSSKAYFPASSGELTSVFTEIASQLSDLRLAK